MAKNAKVMAERAAGEPNASSTSGVAVGSTAGSSSTSNQPFTSSSLNAGVTSNASNSIPGVGESSTSSQNGQGAGSVVQSGATDSMSTGNEGFLGGFAGPQSSPLKRKHSNAELLSNKRQDISDSDDDESNGGKGGPSGFSGGGGPSGPDGGGGPSSSSSLKTMVNDGELLAPYPPRGDQVSDSGTLTKRTPIDFVIELESTTCIHDDPSFFDEII